MWCRSTTSPTRSSRSARPTRPRARPSISPLERTTSSVGELVELASAFFARPAPRLIDPLLYRRVVHPLLLRAARDERYRRALKQQRDLLPVLRDAGPLRRPSHVASRCAPAGIDADAAARLLRPRSSSSRSPPIGAARSAARPHVGAAVVAAVRREQRPAAPPAGSGCWSDDQRAAVGPRRVVPRGRDTRPLTCTSAGSRCSPRTPAGWLPSFAELREHIERRVWGARRATARSSRRCRSACTPRSGSTTPAFSVDRHVYRAPGPLSGARGRSDVDAAAS